jgi:hypothetical protein
VNTEQLTRIAVAFARSTLTPDGRICTACTEVLDVSGTGITMGGGERSAQLCVSDERTAALEEIQFTLGQGPCHDAYVSRAPVGLDRMDAASSRRWPAFVDLAITSGFGAVFAYPLSIDGTTVGVMTLYQEEAGALTPAQHDDSLTLSGVLAETMLSLQDAMPFGVLAPGLDGEEVYRAQTHQAVGMVSVQLGIPLSDALAVLRSHAFASGLSIDVVAADVVARRLRFDDGGAARRQEGTTP